MAYDEQLAERMRRMLAGREGLDEKKMFGGLAFLRDGKMFCGIVKDDLMVRVGPERDAEALARPHVRPMDFTGRPMKGYVFIAPAGCRTEEELRGWIEWGAEFVTTLSAGARRGKRAPAPRSPARGRGR